LLVGYFLPLLFSPVVAVALAALWRADWRRNAQPPDAARVTIATFAAEACMVPCFRGWEVYDPATAVVNAELGLSTGPRPRERRRRTCMSGAPN
jgi:hypothetical protein